MKHASRLLWNLVKSLRFLVTGHESGPGLMLFALGFVALFVLLLYWLNP